MEDIGMTRLTVALAAWMSVVAVGSASLTPRKGSRLVDDDGPQVRASALSARALKQVTARPADLAGSGVPRLARGVPAAGSARSVRPANPLRPGAKAEFVLTNQTEVLLNGKPCKYEQVPGGASIILMEVAEDNKTVLKVYFRTQK
jgi:hypothetical protein